MRLKERLADTVDEAVGFRVRNERLRMRPVIPDPRIAILKVILIDFGGRTAGSGG